MQLDYDLVIIGGGLAGNCLALALQDSGLKIAIIEAQTAEQLHNSPAGDRALALAAGTVNVLGNMGVWAGIADKAEAIKHIHISDQGHFGKTRLSAEKQQVAALGYVIAARDIESYLSALVANTAIKRICPARLTGLMSGENSVNMSLKCGDGSMNLTARLLVGADGGNSSVRKLLDIPQHITDYGQTALVTTVKSTRANQHTAYERFTRSGPLALLPVSKYHSSVVWTRRHDDAEDLMTSPEPAFMAALQACFGYRLGELSLAAPRRAFPLSLIRAERMLCGRAVIIGNAAHQLHPVAGQGFNLGMRDVVQLADLLATQQLGEDIGAADLLKNYVSARQKDHDQVIGFTDGLVKIFSNDWLALTIARNLGLTLLDHIPSAKNLFSKEAMGLPQLEKY
jgi:2-octaprenyl-6-methoxyphenol hydroxylase